MTAMPTYISGTAIRTCRIWDPPRHPTLWRVEPQLRKEDGIEPALQSLPMPILVVLIGAAGSVAVAVINGHRLDRGGVITSSLGVL